MGGGGEGLRDSRVHVREASVQALQVWRGRGLGGGACVWGLEGGIERQQGACTGGKRTGFAGKGWIGERGSRGRGAIRAGMGRLGGEKGSSMVVVLQGERDC